MPHELTWAGHRLGRWVAFVLTGSALALAASVLCAGPAQADPATLAEIEQALAIDEIPADYVILADASTSMRDEDRYQRLKEGLRSFFAALAPKDQVTLATFDSEVNVVHQGEVGRSPDALVEKLPAGANGQATDIGAALEQAVAALGRTGAPEIATVVLVTDGQHEPPAGSAYPFEQGFGWRQLREQVEQLTKQTLRAYALPLAGATGAGLLGEVFPGAVTLRVPSIDDLADQLDRPKRDALDAKIRAALAGDLDQGVSVSWPDGLGRLAPGRNELAVTLRSTTSKIPLTVEGLQARVEGTGFRAELGETGLTLAPGEAVQVPMTVVWSVEGRSWAYRKPVSGTATLSLTGRVGSQWSDTLADDLGLDVQPELSRAPGIGQATGNLGRPWVYHAAALVLLLLAVGLGTVLYRWPRLRGALLVTAPGAGPARTVPLGGLGRSAVLHHDRTGEVEPIRVRIVRTGGEKRLRVDVPAGRKAWRKLLPPFRPATVGSVRYEWQHGDAAPPPAPQPPLVAPPPRTPAREPAGRETVLPKPAVREPATSESAPSQPTVIPPPPQPEPTPPVPPLESAEEPAARID